MSDRTIGLIVPPRSGAVPPDAATVYPDIAFVAEGLGLEEMSVTGFDSVIQSVVAAAVRLQDRGAQAVSLMGTSLSLYRGKQFNEEIVHAMREATGLPASTMSTSVVDALVHLGVQRAAVASAYTSEVHSRLLAFLEEYGLEPAGGAHLSIKAIDVVHEVLEERVLMLGAEAFASSDAPDGLLISCGGLRTAKAVTHLEAGYGIPVVTSPLAGLWAAVRLVDPEAVGNHASRLFQGVPA